MILLASFTSFAKHEVPLSFILILVLYLGKEVFIPGKATNIATYAHIAGGLCGSMFGFLTAPKTRKTKEARLKEIDESSPRNNTFNSNSKKNADNDETVIGSINI
jgi:membrane associated rhomboid family serine protease